MGGESVLSSAISGTAADSARTAVLTDDADVVDHKSRATEIGQTKARAAIRSGPVRTIIERETGFKLIGLAELWQYRELIWLLAARDLKARYRQSLLGIAWTLMQPFFTLAVFVAFFSLLGKTPTASGMPYVVSLLCGIVMWNFFSAVLNSTAASLPSNVHLINKVFCPRLVFPLSTILVALVDLGVSLVVLAAVLAYHRVAPGMELVWFPGFVALSAVVALAMGLWLAALSVRWRDVRFTIPVLLQVGFFASPVFYEAAAMIPERLRSFYYLNPMAGVLEGCRWSLAGVSTFSWQMFAVSGPLSLVLLVIALYSFRRVERTLADYL